MRSWPPRATWSRAVEAARQSERQRPPVWRPAGPPRWTVRHTALVPLPPELLGQRSWAPSHHGMTCDRGCLGSQGSRGGCGWRRLGVCCVSCPTIGSDTPTRAGVPELRFALAGYLGRVRGIRTEPDRIVVTAGVRQGATLLWGVLAASGARQVAVEQPGWGGSRDTAAAAGLLTVPVPVDGHGIAVDQLEGLDVDAVAVTPSHQFPTGAVLSAPRRAMLVAWAQRTGSVVLEDDYDAEFRYDRQPVGALQGLAPQLVVAASSTSKTLAPAVRIGWLVLPQRLVSSVRDRQLTGSRGPSALEQLALADLIRSGDYDRHLRRARRAYHRQRDALLAALAEALPNLSIEGIAAGLHLLLRLPAGTDEAAVVAAAYERGVALEGLAGNRPALVVGYANLHETAVRPAVAGLADAIAAASAASRRAAPGPPRG